MENNNIVYLNCQTDERINDSIEKKYDDYSLEDCVLVRTTDIFPFNKQIETPLNAKAYSFDNSSIFRLAISEKVKQKINYQPFVDDVEDERLKNALSKYYVIFEIFRSTIHFTINGLVSSHMYGNFDNKDYIIVDVLKHHINNPALKSLRVEDVYFNDDLSLSDEAVLIIKEEKFNEIKNNPEYINELLKFKLFIYRGNNQVLAVKQTLKHLGYDSFITNNHGYLNGLNNNSGASKMLNCIDKLRKEHNISAEPHYYSESNQQDLYIRWQEGMKKDIEHFLYLIDNSKTLTLELKNKIALVIQQENINYQTILNSNSNSLERLIDTLKELAAEIIENLDLEEFSKLTNEFNELLLQNIESKNNKVK